MPKASATRLTKRVIDAAEAGAFVWDSEIKGFGVRVTKAGTKSYLFRYRADGAQRYENLGSYPALTVDEARARAAKLRSEKNVDHREVRQRAEAERRRAKTLSDLGDYYLGEYAQGRGLRLSTIGGARRVLGLLGDIGKKRVQDVGKPDIRRLHGEAKGQAGVYQANRLLAVLSKMFALAEENGWRTGDNPCRGIKKFPEDQRWRHLSPNEVARLLDACDAYVGQDPVAGRNAANAVLLLLFTGARLREVLRAEWSQFDLEAGLWEKPSSHTKTRRQHRLELDGPPLQLLRDMRALDPSGRFLFPGEPAIDERGVLIERPRVDLKRPWNWITHEAGLEDVRLHDLRRTTASFMLSGGASLATVGKALGHTQAATTQRYAQLSQTVLREDLRRTNEQMAALRGTAPKAKVLTLERPAPNIGRTKL